MEHQSLSTELHHRLEKIISQPLKQIRYIQRGYTAALRLVVTLADGTSVFAKIATDSLTAKWLRNEHKIYNAISASFMPHYLAWNDDGTHPILILEDLSQAYWSPPWSETQIHQVVETLGEISKTPLSNLPLLKDDLSLIHGWRNVAEQPKPFLSLGLATEKWLEAVLPELLQIDGRKILSGQSLLHLDVRSDNICFFNNRVIFIDWNWACRGNAMFDLGAWLPSLEAEGGPRPETILPDGGEIAALLSGYFASHAGLPSPHNAPYVRQIQLTQLKFALPWMVRALDLPPLDGFIHPTNR